MAYFSVVCEWVHVCLFLFANKCDDLEKHAQSQKTGRILICLSYNYAVLFLLSSLPNHLFIIHSKRTHRLYNKLKPIALIIEKILISKIYKLYNICVWSVYLRARERKIEGKDNKRTL